MPADGAGHKHDVEDDDEDEIIDGANDILSVGLGGAGGG